MFKDLVGLACQRFFIGLHIDFTFTKFTGADNARSFFFHEEKLCFAQEALV